ncbi:hypothetical protein TTHERM_00787060 (macronuclear) [Tetrahymena thermophila SB210]|uniref:Uncharacterized protein n=1 Tax=Tetrahymena thermophila (strain SB210) TaxID=312017 RepID=Q23ZF7_TETTS|nr:hypothetical protein TTHERM_00787060 [Tetrahymena thermophila SB210]EAS01900.2 hypothetical protein TTHERM_00787060 [Tetrahymena thermophila SB210]|eukprot:XP_001022145.2 hypothetical protein TTHERM_00787060 [Tetrahymena thermophila SB210]
MQFKNSKIKRLHNQAIPDNLSPEKQSSMLEIYGNIESYEQYSTYQSEIESIPCNQRIFSQQQLSLNNFSAFSETNIDYNNQNNLLSFPEGLDYQQLIFSSKNSSFESLDEEKSRDQQKKDQKPLAQQEETNLLVKKSYQAMLIQNGNPQKILRLNKKFYLFLDQMIDLEYFENLKSPGNYLENSECVQLTKGFRLINQITHRVDNKFIEVDMEYVTRQPHSIEYIIQFLQSLGNKDLIKYVNCLLEFQKNIDNCQQLIKQQALNMNFLEHRLERKKAADDQFKQLTSQLDPQKLYFYQRYSVNYETCQYESTVAGYSPALYEVIDNGSYSFLEYLSKYGYFDPMSSLFRLGDCFYRTCYFANNLPQEFDEELNKLANLELVTVDNFKFPVTMKLDHHYLEQQYDIQNNLQMNFCDLLAIYEFNFKDLQVYQNLQEARKSNINNQNKLETILGDNVDWEQFDYIQTQFFKKYYQDQISNLVKKGNKWYKRCGFVEIPTKKQKKEF